MKQEDMLIKKRFEEQANRAYMENRYVYTSFLGENQQDILLQSEKEFPIAVSLYGGNDFCERKIAVFGDAQVFGYEPTLPISLLSITPVAKKYADELGHRDVLGAVMNLGIEREVVGDIFFKDKEVYLFCLDKMAEYIKENLCRIKHTVVKTTEITLEQAASLTLAEAKEIRVLVSSLRLDAVVAAVFHLSRQESLALIRDRKVSVKGRISENNSGLLKEESMITVRQKGRFFYKGIEYITKKGKYQLIIQVYY